MKISAVIPTTGRPSLLAAIESVLAQSFSGVLEVIVVSDATEAPTVPDDERIRVLLVGPGAGANTARQRGIDAATGDMVALLDDDDVWHVDKLVRQLAHVSEHIDIESTEPWVSATSATVMRRGRTEVWPRRVIGPHQDFADYLFRLRSLTMGRSFLQSSTLLMPRWLVRDAVRFDPGQKVHQDLGWMLEFRDTFPEAPILQTPEPLTHYLIATDGISRSFAVDDSVRFGVAHLSDRPDLLADFLLTFPVERAAAAHDHTRIRAILRDALRIGRPSVFALSRAVVRYVQTVRLSRTVSSGGPR